MEKIFTPIEKPKTIVEFDIDEHEKCYTSLNPLIEKICADHTGKHELRINVKLNNTNYIQQPQ